MFVGHFAAGMAGKKINTDISLGTYFLASQFLDLLWPTFLLLDLEHVIIVPGISAVSPLEFIDYPFSHSLIMVAGWSFCFGLAFYLVKRSLRGAILLAGLVLSHWFLDLIVHIPDLPLFPGSSFKAGLGLWNSIILTTLVEGGIFILGIFLYVTSKKNAGQRVSWKFWSLIAFLTIIQAMNFLGPPPPSIAAIAWAGQLQWLFIPWAWWADKE